jgi:RNA polymerase sigma-70 factor (ECF subfamily)
VITDATARAQVYGWAYRLLRNHHDALDATQEVLLRSLRQPAVELQQPGAWLRRVTVNHCLDVIRSRRTAVRIAPEKIDALSPDYRAAHAELHAAIVDALANLSDQQRTVLISKVFDQETFAEIAATMHVAIPTVKTHYLRGLRALRRSLHAHAEDLS